MELTDGNGEVVVVLRESISLLKLQPGDRLAILLPSESVIEEEYLAQMRQVLQDAWPEIVTVVFTGDVELTVIRAEE